MRRTKLNTNSTDWSTTLALLQWYSKGPITTPRHSHTHWHAAPQGVWCTRECRRSRDAQTAAYTRQRETCVRACACRRRLLGKIAGCVRGSPLRCAKCEEWGGETHWSGEQEDGGRSGRERGRYKGMGRKAGRRNIRERGGNVRRGRKCTGEAG